MMIIFLCPQLDHAVPTARRNERLLLRFAQHHVRDAVYVADRWRFWSRSGALVHVAAATAVRTGTLCVFQFQFVHHSSAVNQAATEKKNQSMRDVVKFGFICVETI